jgi:hypothetical protein
MIISIYKPIKEKKKILGYEILPLSSLYDRGSQRYKVSYICDKIECRKPNKVYNITREHLSEKRSSTVNEKIQICRTCQMTGEKNPRFGDKRTWSELFDTSKMYKMKESLRERNRGENNPSKKDSVKNKKNQFIINFENVSNSVKEFDFILNSIKGSNKFAELNLTCCNGHNFEIKWCSFRVRRICRYCYYESQRIPIEKIKRFKIYNKKVRYLTRFNFNKNLEKIENSKLKLNDSKKFHIDHIYSISDGFINNIDYRIIASHHNLRVITKDENLKKGSKSDITSDELLKRYNS